MTKFNENAPEDALVHNWDDRLRIASLFKSRIHLREGEISEAPICESAYIEEIEKEIARIKGSWLELLGVEYPAVL